MKSTIQTKVLTSNSQNILNKSFNWGIIRTYLIKIHNTIKEAKEVILILTIIIKIMTTKIIVLSQLQTKQANNQNHI